VNCNCRKAHKKGKKLKIIGLTDFNSIEGYKTNKTPVLMRIYGNLPKKKLQTANFYPAIGKRQKVIKGKFPPQSSKFDFFSLPTCFIKLGGYNSSKIIFPYRQKMVKMVEKFSAHLEKQRGQNATKRTRGSTFAIGKTIFRPQKIDCQRRL